MHSFGLACWDNKLNLLFPSSTINIDKANYLTKQNISNLQVIRNTFNISLIKLDKRDITDIEKIIEPIADSFSLRIINNKPIFLELFFAMQYIFQIKNILDTLPKHQANYLGTKNRSSSEKALVTKHINHLKERLNSPFFPLEDENIIELTKLQIKYIERFIEKDNRKIPDLLNLINTFFGFDHKLLDLTQLEQKAMKQVCSLFNGIRTSDKEFVKSALIFTSMQFETEQIKKEQLADIILDFCKFFFYDIFEKDSKQQRKILAFTKKNFNKTPYAKTFINDTIIFSYLPKNQEDFILKYAYDGLKDILQIDSFDFYTSKIENISISENFSKQTGITSEYHIGRI